MTDQLQQYIHDQRAQGVDDATTKKALRDVGWSEEQITAAFQALGRTAGPVDLRDAFSQQEQRTAEPSGSHNAPPDDATDAEQEKARDPSLGYGGVRHTVPHDAPRVVRFLMAKTGISRTAANYTLLGAAMLILIASAVLLIRAAGRGSVPDRYRYDPTQDTVDDVEQFQRN